MLGPVEDFRITERREYDMSVSVDISNIILQQLQDIVDDATMLEIHTAFAKRCDPYVPMDEGALSQSAFAQVTPQYVQWGNEAVPYAHYLYEGNVYGPNIPIIENGVIVGWFSIPNMPKSPTGRSMNYSTEKHPRATAHWDEVMMQEQGDEFTKDVENILLRRAREIYGR